MNEHNYGATHPGLVRKNNEDAFFVQPVLGGAFTAACVIDGVGGYEGGEVAAQLAKEVFTDYLRIASGEVGTMMLEAMVAANDKIIAAKKARPDLADMACVATLVLTDEENNRFHYVHVGDTRLYLYRDGSLVKVSKDQSFVGYLEENGRLSEQEAMNHPKRNEIDKALGFDGGVRNTKDYFDAGSSPFLPGDQLLLCSDGLTDLVPAGNIKDVLQSEKSLREKVETLIHTANEAGGRDNITVIIVTHSRQPLKQRALKPKKKISSATKVVAPATLEKKSKAGPPDPLKTPPGPLQPKGGRKAVLFLAVLCGVLLLALGWLLYRQIQGQNFYRANQPSAEEIDLRKLLAGAKDSVVLEAGLFPAAILLRDTLKLSQDSLIIRGNDTHILASDGFNGAGILLTPSNRFLLLQDLVLENFTIGILAKGQTVQLKNVKFLNCIVPVQYGYSVPVNSPVNVTISDTLFSTKDTLAP